MVLRKTFFCVFFCLARKLYFLDGLKKNVSTRLLSFRYGFDCGRRPAFSSASRGSRGGAPVLCPVAFLPCGASWSAVASVAQAFAVPGSGPCRSIPRAGRQRRSGRKASVRRGVESTGKIYVRIRIISRRVTPRDKPCL